MGAFQKQYPSKSSQVHEKYILDYSISRFMSNKSIGRKQSSGYLGLEVQGKLIAKGIRELCGIIRRFCILLMMVVPRVYIFDKFIKLYA